MRDGKGYLLPPDPQPEGYQCLLLYIPDDPTGHYLAAMAGAFVDMGAWLNWEKDGTNRASLAAATWKNAIDFTFENGWLQCEDMNDKLDDILRQLEELNNMNINVNCGGCGCGCGCGNQENFQDLSQEPGYQPFPDEPIILPGEELVNLCDAANQWADGVTETMQRMKSFFGGLQVTASTVEAFLLGIGRLAKFKLVLSPALFFQLIVGAIAVILSANLTDEANDAAQEFEDAFKCAIFTALTPQGAKTNVLGVVSQIRQSYGVMVSALFYALVMITDWRAVTIENEALILPEYIGAGDCSDCGGATPIELANDWWLVPAVEGDEEVTTGSLVVTNYVWAYSAALGERAESYASIDEFLSGFTFPGTLEESGHLAGFALQRMSEDVAVSFEPFPSDPLVAISTAQYAASEIFTKWYTGSDLDKTSFQNSIVAAFPGQPILHTADREAFDNLSQRRVAINGTESEPTTASFRVWFVVHVDALSI